MNKKQKDKLDRILKDKSSGSSEILLNLNKFILSNIDKKSFLNDSIIRVKKKLSHFAVVKNYLSDVEKLIKHGNHKKLVEYLEQIGLTKNKTAISIFNKLYKKVPQAKTILTFSRSGTIINVLKLWKKKNPNLNVIISESRPEFEGRLMAKELLKSGFKINLITDAMTGMFVKNVDAVIIGADAVLRNKNVINKTGSLSLALLCKHYKKPFYVLTSRSKILISNNYKLIAEDPEKVWKFSHPKLKTINIPFEEIDKKLITGIISD